MIDKHVRSSITINQQRPLKPVDVGEGVRIRDNSGLWQPAVVTREHDPRSVIVQTKSGGIYRRNRRHVLKTHEIPFGTQLDGTEHTDSDFCTQSDITPDNSDTQLSNSSQSPASSPRPINSRNDDEPYITRSGRAVKTKTIVSM